MSKAINRILKRIPSFKKRMMEISFDIAGQIYEYMKEAGNMSQKDLATKLKKKESEISKWMSGGHNFTIETIAKIEEVFNKKIIVVPMYASEDLDINYNSSKNIQFIIHPTVVTTEADVFFPQVSEGWNLLANDQNRFPGTFSNTIN